jgi:hypothetical protein
MRNLISAAACAGIRGDVGCNAGTTRDLAGRASDEWKRSYPLAAGGEVQIVGGSGSVEIHGGTGSTIEVIAERVARAATDEAAREVVPRIEIHGCHPDKVVIQSEGLRGIVIGVDQKINYKVTVPAFARVRVRTVDGPITITDVEGRVVASSANGEVVIRNVKGGVDARSVNQNVTVDLASFANDPVDVRAVNGNIALTLPKSTNATLEANLTNGTIDVKDVPFESFGEQTRRRTRGRLNAGGPPIDVTTINGNITVGARP